MSGRFGALRDTFRLRSFASEHNASVVLRDTIRPRRQSNTRIKCILYQLQPGPSPTCYPIPVRRWRTTEQFFYLCPPINIHKHLLVYVLVLSSVSREGTALRQSEPGCMRSTRGQLSSSLEPWIRFWILVTVLLNKPHSFIYSWLYQRLLGRFPSHI